MKMIQKIQTSNDVHIYRIDNWNEEEERYEIEIDGVRYHLSYSSHDSDGWAGMAAARNIVETFAKLFGIEIEDWDVEGSGQDQPEVHHV